MSCNTGEGHNSCAKAIKEVYDIHHEDCIIADALRFISEKTSNFISKGHVFVYRNIPWLFNRGYAFTEKHDSVFKEKKMMYKFFAKGADNLYKYIVRSDYDTVICTHPFASLMLTEMQRRYNLKIKTAFVATDYTCSPSVKDSDLNYYFIPSELLLSDFECTNISKEKIVACGIPIRQMFYKETPKNDAKASLGIEPECKHMVIMCGSMGCGPIEKLAGTLTERLSDGFELTVVCGTNDKLKWQLENRYKDRKNLHVLGFVKDMSTMLDSADLYLTKAGGISVTEAATKKVPMLFINAVAGCEDYNSTFYTQIGCAEKSDDIEELTEKCKLVSSDSKYYEAMVSSFDKLSIQNAAECIYSTMKSS